MYCISIDIESFLSIDKLFYISYIMKDKKPKYITANKDVNIIYSPTKKEFFLKVPPTCLLKCEVPKDKFMRAVESCFNSNSIRNILDSFTKTKPEARLRLSIKPNGSWKVSFSHTSIDIIEFCLVITSDTITPQEAGELLYQQFLTCNGKVAVDITLWY
jgi:hypothetical protein